MALRKQECEKSALNWKNSFNEGFYSTVLQRPLALTSALFSFQEFQNVKIKKMSYLNYSSIICKTINI